MWASYIPLHFTVDLTNCNYQPCILVLTFDLMNLNYGKLIWAVDKSKPVFVPQTEAPFVPGCSIQGSSLLLYAHQHQRRSHLSDRVTNEGVASGTSAHVESTQGIRELWLPALVLYWNRYKVLSFPVGYRFQEMTRSRVRTTVIRQNKLFLRCIWEPILASRGKRVDEKSWFKTWFKKILTVSWYFDIKEMRYDVRIMTPSQNIDLLSHNYEILSQGFDNLIILI